jgi:hypothetical protein
MRFVGRSHPQASVRSLILHFFSLKILYTLKCLELIKAKSKMLGTKSVEMVLSFLMSAVCVEVRNI